MKAATYLLAAGIVCLPLLGQLQGHAAEKTDEVRDAIAKSLPFIVEKGQWWIDKKKCVSCHRIAVMTWSLKSAKDRGFDVDADKLEGWMVWSLSHQLGEHENGGPVGAKNLEGVAQLILGGTRSQKDAELAKSHDRFLELMVKGQEAAGRWKPGGQLPAQNRSAEETAAVSTIWIATALESGRVKEAVEAREKAIGFLKDAKPGETTEWHAARLLLDVTLERTAEVPSRIKALVERQKPDGGWGWKKDSPSDALATGQAIYALMQAGQASNDPAILRAQKFLISTQREDGSWSVPGTKKNKKGKPAETAIYWGTCWAAIGLLETLPE